MQAGHSRRPGHVLDQELPAGAFQRLHLAPVTPAAPISLLSAIGARPVPGTYRHAWQTSLPADVGLPRSEVRGVAPQPRRSRLPNRAIPDARKISNQADCLRNSCNTASRSLATAAPRDPLVSEDLELGNSVPVADVG
jgi:hypothetical protein